MKANLSGKVALVTGSSQGIGKAIAVTFAENGADVAINGRNEATGLPVVEQIKKLGRKSIFESADINSYKEVKRMVDNVIKKMGKIDIMVANGGAGDPPPMFFRDIDPDIYMKYAVTRWFCRVYCIRAVLDHMIERQYGKIIIITTDAGRIPTPGESMNGAAAAAVILMNKALANEFTRWKIRVNTICTTITQDTPSLQRVLAAGASKVFEKAAAKMPFGVNKPQDIAEAALYLASPDSDQMTGQILSINGGLSFPG